MNDFNIGLVEDPSLLIYLKMPFSNQDIELVVEISCLFLEHNISILIIKGFDSRALIAASVSTNRSSGTLSRVECGNALWRRFIFIGRLCENHIGSTSHFDKIWLSLRESAGAQ